MKNLIGGEEKLQKICDRLKLETLEPAKLEAQSLIEEAKRESARIIAQAKVEADQILNNSRTKQEKELAVFQSSLQQSARQAIEGLRQTIEERFFNQNLLEILKQPKSDAPLSSRLISAIIEALKKEGINANLSALIPQTISPEEVNRLLGEEILSALQKKKVSVGSFGAGVQVSLFDQKITLEITDSSLKELLASYLRKDFRKWIFADSETAL